MSIPDDRSEGTPIFESTVQTHDTENVEGSAAPTDVAREQASRVADSAVDAGKDVVNVAKSEAGNVAQEAKYQAQDLLRQTQDELRDQAAQRQTRLAQGLRSVGDDLHQMASASDTQGVASDLVRQAAHRSHSAASWLAARDPEGVLRELKSYARRRPGVFIAAAIVAGVVAGRLTRALAAGPASADGSSRQRMTGSGSSMDRGRYTTGAVTTGSAMTGSEAGGYAATGGSVGAAGYGETAGYADATGSSDLPTGEVPAMGGQTNPVPPENPVMPEGYDETSDGDRP